MMKTITRLAVVAVAAVLCSGPGLAWGGWTTASTVPATGAAEFPGGIYNAFDGGWKDVVVLDSLTPPVASMFDATLTSSGSLGQVGAVNPIVTGDFTGSKSQPWTLDIVFSNTYSLDPVSGWGLEIASEVFGVGTLTAKLSLYSDAGLSEASLIAFTSEDFELSEIAPLFLGQYWDGSGLFTPVMGARVSMTTAASIIVDNTQMVQFSNFRGMTLVDDGNPGPGPGPGPEVPEPTTLAIWSLLSLIGLAVVRRRRRV